MIRVDASRTLASLREAKELIKRRLESVVVQYAVELTGIASENTRVGSPGEGSTNWYNDQYRRREAELGISAESGGFHAGAYRYSESNQFSLDPEIYSKAFALQAVSLEAKASYRLGDTVYIGAEGPAYAMLESGTITIPPNSISQPTLEQIVRVFGLDARTYYNKASV